MHTRSGCRRPRRGAGGCAAAAGLPAWSLSNPKPYTCCSPNVLLVRLLQESAAGDSLDEALADAQLQRDCQQRLAALVAVLRADHMQVPKSCQQSA